MLFSHSCSLLIAHTVQTKFDASTLHDQPKLAADSGMVDDGTGAKEIFRVDNFDLVQVPDEDHGKFYSGDCYVILYAYNNGGQDRFIVYFWLVSTLCLIHFFSSMYLRDENEAFHLFLLL